MLPPQRTSRASHAIAAGKGAGVYFAGDPDALSGYEIVYQIIVSFNAEYCTFSGSLFNLQTTPMITAGVQWDYDGSKMEGDVAYFEKDGDRNAYVLGSYEHCVLSPAA